MPKIHPYSASNTNVLHSLYIRETGFYKSNYRLNLRILQRLVSSESTRTLTKILEVHSKQPITYEDGKLYFDNYKSCFALCGKNSLPSQIYALPTPSGYGKIEDAVVYTGPVYKNPSSPESYKTFFLALTTNNWLCSYSNDTGKLLQVVYLGPHARYKFRHVDWERQGETVSVMSIQNQKPALDPRTRNVYPGNRPRVLVTIAVFSILPLEFCALLEIDREVFGKECNHVNVSEGLLIVGIGSSSLGSVRLYSFHEIIEKGTLFSAKLNQPCSALDGALVGSCPAGIPLNCKISEAPPILFEVKCSDLILHFGGYPYHYITTPPRCEGTFQVKAVASDDLVENGILDFPNNSTEPNTIAFHPDDSGRIIHNSNHAVRFFKLVQNGSNQISLLKCFEITTDGESKPIKESLNECRTSQRVGKKRFAAEMFHLHERTVFADDYENELDLYGVLGASPDDICEGKILLYDNLTGKKIRTVDLKLNLDELSDYSFTLDLECLIILAKNEFRRFSCYIYRLSHFEPPQEEGDQYRRNRRRVTMKTRRSNNT